MDYISEKIAQYPDQASEYAELGALYEKKLWHELSVKVESLLLQNLHFTGPVALELFSQFLAQVISRMNPIKLAVIVSLIGHSLPNIDESMDLFERVLGSRTSLDKDAVLCLDMDIAFLLVRQGHTDKARTILETYDPVINGKQTTESVAFSKYFKSLAEYKKVVGPAQDFYSAGIQYLSYSSMDDLRPVERRLLARDMAIAALSGEGIYHFGEVLATPILNSLTGTEDEWLQHLVRAINSGDVKQFQAITQQYQINYATLSMFHENIRWKALLLALITLIFERPSHSRIISFSAIADRCDVGLDQVEWIVMKAMALGLVKGSLNEVEQTLKATWIQPRVLDIGQLSAINDQLGVWIEKTKTALIAIEDNATELFV